MTILLNFKRHIDTHQLVTTHAIYLFGYAIHDPSAAESDNVVAWTQRPLVIMQGRRLARSVEVHVGNLVWRPDCTEFSAIEQKTLAAQACYRRHAVADEYDRAPIGGHFFHFAETFFLKLRIAHRQNFINDEDFRIQVRSDRKRKACMHTA